MRASLEEQGYRPVAMLKLGAVLEIGATSTPKIEKIRRRI